MILAVVISYLILLHVSKGDNIRHLNNISPDNWTSCYEFLNNTKFDPVSVVDIDWKIFYFWHYDFEESYNIKFSIPTPSLIDRFRVELNDELKPPVNWTDADLFVETSIDLSGLFIKTNVSGLYRLIPSLSFHLNDTPYLTFGLKVVAPGYLGIVNCKHRLAYALAPVDDMPPPSELVPAASKLGFWSPFGRSYLVDDNFIALAIPPTEHLDNADDDAQDDIDRQINNIQIL
ncbi:uncharacterized protein LOC131848412 [Achroia grisella]|uniref:uncharacterized protein LOC131848412 n=1 Tax=Achroia grisella TaxID=688607 RepID=UPI0027D24C5D|nr:uncharacterized protein LOC131848412 [Achroia grisella]